MFFTKHITDSRILCFCVISDQLCYCRMSIKKQLKIQTREFDPEQGREKGSNTNVKSKGVQLYVGPQRVNPTNPDKFPFKFRS